MDIRSAQFVKSNADGINRKGLAPLPEIALVGRSNVGKSSLINTLCMRRQLARVSGTPGKTRLVNYFLINDSFYLVDLPGYGYASVSRDEQAKWAQMVEGYLSGSEFLRHILLLVDIRHAPSQADQQMAYWIQHYDIPCTIVATKGDKIAKSKRKPLAAGLSDGLNMTFRTPTIVFSSLNGEGKAELCSRIGEILEL